MSLSVTTIKDVYLVFVPDERIVERLDRVGRDATKGRGRRRRL